VPRLPNLFQAYVHVVLVLPLTPFFGAGGNGNRPLHFIEFGSIMAIAGHPTPNQDPFSLGVDRRRISSKAPEVNGWTLGATAAYAHGGTYIREGGYVY